jgi:hypothetical protein
MEMLATAQDLMTAADDLLAVDAGMDWEPALRSAKRRHYDIVPYRENGRIAGIVQVVSGAREALTPRWLLSADTSMPDLLEILAASDPAVRLVLHGEKVVGLVSAADLNKMPMRVYLYHVVGSLELALAAYLRREHRGDLVELVESLSGKRREQVKEDVAQLPAGDADVDPIQHFQLSDLINCVEKREQLQKPLGYESRNQANVALGPLNKLRNCTMHLVRPVITSVPEDLGKLRDRVALAWDLIEQLEKCSEDPTA